jgi:hypothetical protein
MTKTAWQYCGTLVNLLSQAEYEAAANLGGLPIYDAYALKRLFRDQPFPRPTPIEWENAAFIEVDGHRDIRAPAITLGDGVTQLALVFSIDDNTERCRIISITEVTPRCPSHVVHSAEEMRESTAGQSLTESDVAGIHQTLTKYCSRELAAVAEVACANSDPKTLLDAMELYSGPLFPPTKTSLAQLPIYVGTDRLEAEVPLLPAKPSDGTRPGDLEDAAVAFAIVRIVSGDEVARRYCLYDVLPSF